MTDVIEFPTNSDGTIRELSIATVTNTDLPDWYRTDTPHIEHPHDTNSRCLPGVARHRDVRKRNN